MVSGASFATSTAGYITGIVTPVATALLVFIIGSMRSRFRKIEDTLTRQNETLAAQTQGMAVMVSQMEPMDRRVSTLEESDRKMAAATAVLQDALTKHERWHERHDERTR